MFDILLAISADSFLSSILLIKDTYHGPQPFKRISHRSPLPEHQKAFQPQRDRYDALARQARIGAEKIAAFFQELSALIFQDMRQNGKKKLESCVEAGRAAAQTLSDPSLPYTYIAEEILRIEEELSATPLEEVTLCLLEDASFRLEAVAFAANVDIWRQP